MCRKNSPLKLLSGNQQQHQIIFGKSKESILVPDWTFNATNSSDNQANYKQQQQSTNQQEADLIEQRQAANKRLAANVTTMRVLTDQNGHSIKVRLTSPPLPRRQSSQLSATTTINGDNNQAQDSWHPTQIDLWAPSSSNGSRFAHRDSLASNCPLISLNSTSFNMEDEEDNNETIKRSEMRPNSCIPSKRNKANTTKRRRHSEVWAPKQNQLQRFEIKTAAAASGEA